MKTRRTVFAAAAALVLLAALTGCKKSAVPAEPQIVRETVVVEKEVVLVVTATPDWQATADAQEMTPAEPTATPMATATSDPMQQRLDDMTVGELLALLGSAAPEMATAAGITATEVVTVTTQWFTATNVLTAVTPLKEQASNCRLPIGCNVVADPGVLGADDLAEADRNPSAVWTGAWHHQLADQVSAGVLVPEGSYLTAYASGMVVEVMGAVIELPECGPDCGWGLLIRGWHEDHIPVKLTNLGSPGGLGYTRYPVPKESGQYFSYDYLSAQALNALEFDNCGIEGCSVLLQAVLDVNDFSLAILRFTAEAGWEAVWTNMVPTANQP